MIFYVYVPQFLNFVVDSWVSYKIKMQTVNYTAVQYTAKEVYDDKDNGWLMSQDGWHLKNRLLPYSLPLWTIGSVMSVTSYHFTQAMLTLI